MLIFVAIFVVICCGLVIILGISLSSQLEDVGDDVKRIKDNVGKIYTELTYGSWFTSTYRDLDKKLVDINDHLTTEIACLATKNNEDIKRMGGNFEEWDLIELDGREQVIVRIYTNANGSDMVSCVCSDGQTYVYYKERLADAKFIRHAETPFGEER